MLESLRDKWPAGSSSCRSMTLKFNIVQEIDTSMLTLCLDDHVWKMLVNTVGDWKRNLAWDKKVHVEPSEIR